MMAMMEKEIPTAAVDWVLISDKIGVGHDIERSDQHTDDGRNGQSSDKARYRCRGHKRIFILGHRLSACRMWAKVRKKSPLFS